MKHDLRGILTAIVIGLCAGVGMIALIPLIIFSLAFLFDPGGQGRPAVWPALPVYALIVLLAGFVCWRLARGLSRR